MKFKEPFKTGQIYKSEEYPQYDFVIDFVTYNRMADDVSEFNDSSIICWQRINDEAFERFVCKEKNVDSFKELFANGRTTHPYAYFGEGKINSIKNMIKKYNMKYIGMSGKEVVIYKDDDWEFSSGFKG